MFILGKVSTTIKLYLLLVLFIQRRLKAVLTQHQKDRTRLMEIFEQERFNLLKNLSSIKKKELDKEEHLKFAIKGLQNIECGKPLVICSNYMDACRDI